MFNSCHDYSKCYDEIVTTDMNSTACWQALTSQGCSLPRLVTHALMRPDYRQRHFQLVTAWLKPTGAAKPGARFIKQCVHYHRIAKRTSRKASWLRYVDWSNPVHIRTRAHPRPGWSGRVIVPAPLLDTSASSSPYLKAKSVVPMRNIHWLYTLSAENTL